MRKFPLALLLCVLLTSCPEPVEMKVAVNFLSGRDSDIPCLVKVESISETEVCLVWSEPVRVFSSGYGVMGMRADGKNLFITFGKALPPGRKTSIEGRVIDMSGNSTGFSVEVWGYNPNTPEILINEFTTKGTAGNPDRTELLVLEDGNMAAMVLYGGSPVDHDCVFIFPDIEVRSGSFMVIWWTESLPEGVSEHPSDSVWNFCAGEDSDLSSNNGVLMLLSSPSPGSEVVDAVVYSNFSSSYEGFGTRSAYERYEWVLDKGAWNGDALDSSSGTATRSFSRKPSSVDSDSLNDWYITVTRGSTFGLANTSEPYE